MPVYPRVTEILRSAGLTGDMTFVPEYALERGSAVHAAIHYLNDGDLHRASVSPEIEGRLAAYERWKLEVQPEIVACELEVSNDLYRYNGRLDLLAMVRGRTSVIDFKGGDPSPWHGPQLAAYANAYGQPMAARFGLYLKDDGSYRLVSYSDAHDWQVFVAAASLHHWKLSKGLIHA